MPAKDQKPPMTPPKPSTASQIPITRGSPPGAPQKPSSSAPNTVVLPIRPPPTQTSTMQATRLATPGSQEFHEANASPSTPKAAGSPPKPAPGSVTPRTAPRISSATQSPATSPLPLRQSPSERPQLSSRALLPAPRLLETTSKSKALTIFQAFSAPLPTFNVAKDFESDLGNHESSDLVGGTTPPRYWSEINVAHYLDMANLYLAKPAVKNYLEMHCAPSLESTFIVRREADVVMYSRLHLTHAVNMAIGGAVFPGQIEMVSELQAGGLRPDCMWRPAGSPAGGHMFAILEMKITGGINPNDFYAARSTDTEENEAIAQTRDQDPPNRFSSDILNIIKQATAYSHNVKFGTRYIALFDGRYLFLGVFSQGTNDAPLLEGTLVPCLGEKGGDARKALLGWLIEAKTQSQRGQNHSIRQVPARAQPTRSAKANRS